jgi:hypothetical protein
MRDQMHSGMAEATRLTQQGRLDGATAAIQRALGGTFVPTEGPGGSSDGPIDVTSRVVRRTPRGPAEAGYATRLRPNAATQTVPPPNPLTRGVESKSGRGVYAAEGGRFVERSFTNGAGTRSYKLYIPGGYAGQPVPLVVMLHGCTQNPDDFAAGTRMNGLVRLVHGPQGPRRLGRDGAILPAASGTVAKTTRGPGIQPLHRIFPAGR